ncbi:MAG: hypothetical protein ACJA1E_001898 [Paracoccaceae bacterium]|jgi:hypothetical protein
MTCDLGLTSLVTLVIGTFGAFALTLKPTQTVDNPAPIENAIFGFSADI